ncbi:MAG: hypothetical protein ABI685_00795 [Ferruginibacter sp.]
MFAAKRYIILLLLVLAAFNLPAQNLTGTWEGKLSNDQFLQLNILQTGDKICGYTRDHVLADKKSFCKAFFEGRFDKQKNRLIISGKYFLENSGGHVLMNLNLNYKTVKGVEVLEEKPSAASVFSRMLSLFGVTEEGDFVEDDSSRYVYIKKVSDQPYEIIDLMQDCIKRDKKMTDTITKFVFPPKDSFPPVVKIITPEKPKEILPPVVSAPVEIKKDSITTPKTLTQRKNIEQSNIEIDVKTINLKVYDNAIMDGDTVSIFYNGKLLLSHQLLTEKGIEINLELDEHQTRHEIVLFAENLGSIPPNTALVVITAGTKRYELFASASLEENAVLVFNYRPK